jgi:hypothetical protein
MRSNASSAAFSLKQGIGLSCVRFQQDLRGRMQAQVVSDLIRIRIIGGFKGALVQT